MQWIGNTRPAGQLAALLLLCGFSVVSLGACSGDNAEDVPRSDDGRVDPAMARALDEQIMVDPDLVDQNMASAAINIAAPDGSLPTHELGLRALADARAAALIEIGGPGKMLKAPRADGDAGLFLSQAAANGECAQQAEYTMQWAARLPRSFPVYPHGAVQEAAGSDAAGCTLRVVSFITPVPLDEVIDYYFSHASQAGFSAARVIEDGDDILWGMKAGGGHEERGGHGERRAREGWGVLYRLCAARSLRGHWIKCHWIGIRNRSGPCDQRVLGVTGGF